MSDFFEQIWLIITKSIYMFMGLSVFYHVMSHVLHLYIL